MLKKGDISTEADTGPFFFSLTAFAGSLIAALLLFILGGGNGLAVFAGIMMSIVAVAALAVFFAIVTDRAYIEGDTLFMSYLFKRSQLSLKDIGRIKYKDEVYSVYDKRGTLIGTINGKLTGIDKIIQRLDKADVPFE